MEQLWTQVELPPDLPPGQEQLYVLRRQSYEARQALRALLEALAAPGDGAG